MVAEALIGEGAVHGQEVLGGLRMRDVEDPQLLAPVGAGACTLDEPVRMLGGEPAAGADKERRRPDPGAPPARSDPVSNVVSTTGPSAETTSRLDSARSRIDATGQWAEFSPTARTFRGPGARRPLKNSRAANAVRGVAGQRCRPSRSDPAPRRADHAAPARRAAPIGCKLTSTAVQVAWKAAFRLPR